MQKSYAVHQWRPELRYQGEKSKKAKTRKREINLMKTKNITFTTILLLLASFALSPAALARPHPSPTPTPTPSPTPTPAPGATLWYVPGVDNSYDHANPPNLFAFASFSIINPGAQAGTVTLTLRT